MTIIRYASTIWNSIFSQQPMNRTRRRTTIRSKSSSLPLDEAILLLADEPCANSQTDRSDYLNERNGQQLASEILNTARLVDTYLC